VIGSLLYEVVTALVAALLMVVWVRPQTFKFLLDKGSLFPSLGRQGQYTAMIVSTWLLVAVALLKKGDVPEWMFIGYMLSWAGAQFGSLWLKMKGGQVGTTTTTTTTDSSTQAVVTK
jgi:hypothetical protein